MAGREGTAFFLHLPGRCAAEKRHFQGRWHAEPAAHRLQLLQGAPGEEYLPRTEEAIREKLDLFRWTEEFFGDDDYPLTVGDQLKLFADEVAKLPVSEDEKWEIMSGFTVSQGTFRRPRASSALKQALKDKE